MNLCRHRTVYWFVQPVHGLHPFGAYAKIHSRWIFHKDISEGAAYAKLRPTERIFLVESRNKRDRCKFIGEWDIHLSSERRYTANGTLVAALTQQMNLWLTHNHR